MIRNIKDFEIIEEMAKHCKDILLAYGYSEEFLTKEKLEPYATEYNASFL